MGKRHIAGLRTKAREKKMRCEKSSQNGMAVLQIETRGHAQETSQGQLCMSRRSE